MDGVLPGSPFREGLDAVAFTCLLGIASVAESHLPAVTLAFHGSPRQVTGAAA